MRQIILDTETTGLEFSQGHRIIEIGCVELKNRRRSGHDFHHYLNPEREIDDGAFDVHGISNEMLADKPRFCDIARELIDYLRDAEVIIHNAPFDTGFINSELEMLGAEWGRIENYCSIIDTLVMARERHPGQKNSLDALCQRYNIDNSQREQHGALLDARILSDVYLAMTGGQADLSLYAEVADETPAGMVSRQLDPNRSRLRIIQPTADELAAHEKRLAAIDKRSSGKCVWKTINVKSEA